LREYTLAPSFVMAAYVPCSTATLGPAVMSRCCVHVAFGDDACDLVVHHMRE